MILIFGGTTEGRAAVEVLDTAGREYYYSTRGFGQQIECSHGIHIVGGMEATAMASFCLQHEIRLLVDAAHPFAEKLHQNIASVSEKLHIPVVRYERIYPPRNPRWIWCDTYSDAVDWLENQQIKNLLALSGVQTIPKLKDWWSKHPSWFRVLNRQESIDLALSYGFPKERLAFFDANETEGLLIESLQPDAILTKESGLSGYFTTKEDIAAEKGIPLIVIKRPVLSEGFYVVTGKQGLRYRVERLVPGFFHLNSGFTTGSCACAAAKSALKTLISGEEFQRIDIALPNGEAIDLPIFRTIRTGDTVTCSVKKDSGDDPDITNGCEICATVELVDSGITFKAGPGVGIVTLPGLGLDIGEPAINIVPRQMIASELGKVLQSASLHQGVVVTISVPGGEELAVKTFNPKLGIMGGISIIGTSGVVRPFSSDAFLASIRKEIQVAKALGCKHVVINSGAKSEKVLHARFPEFIPQAFIHYGNYIGATLNIIEQEGIERVTMGIMIGKAVKLAEGHADTHSRNVVMNKDFIVSLLKDSDCDETICTRVYGFSLARELWNILPVGHPFYGLLVQRCVEVCRKFLKNTQLEIILIPEFV